MSYQSTGNMIDNMLGKLRGGALPAGQPASVTPAPSPEAPNTVKMPTVSTAWKILATVGAASAAYHGYRRNGSIFWASVWSIGGALSPIFTNVVAVAQGYGKRKGG
jgi:hypothetical protein